MRPYQPPGVWDGVAFKLKYVPDDGAKRYRRSLYTYWKRTVPPPAICYSDSIQSQRGGLVVFPCGGRL